MSLKTKVIKFLAVKAVKSASKKFDAWLLQGGYTEKEGGLEAPKDASGLAYLLPIGVAVGVALAIFFHKRKDTGSTTTTTPSSFLGFGGSASTDYSSIPAPVSYPGQASKAAAAIRSGYFHTAQSEYYRWSNKSRRLCGAGTVSALQVLGINVRRVAKAKDLGPSLIEAGYYKVGSYSIPASGNIHGNFQLGDVLVFSNHNHAEVYIPGVSGSGWVSDFFQENTNPYKSMANVTLYRMKQGSTPAVSSSPASKPNATTSVTASVNQYNPSGQQGSSASTPQYVPTVYCEETTLSESTYNQRR